MAYVQNPTGGTQFGGFGSFGGFSPTAGLPAGINIGGVNTSPTFPSGAPSGPGGGSFWSWLAGLGQNALSNPQTWMAGAQMLGSIGETQSRNRREAQDRESKTVDLLQRADYLRNRPEGMDTYTSGPSSKVRKSADDLQNVLMERLENASAGPSFWERFNTIAAPAMGIYGVMGAPGMPRR
jgi:hypothetical protein